MVLRNPAAYERLFNGGRLGVCCNYSTNSLGIVKVLANGDQSTPFEIGFFPILAAIDLVKRETHDDFSEWFSALDDESRHALRFKSEYGIFTIGMFRGEEHTSPFMKYEFPQDEFFDYVEGIHGSDPMKRLNIYQSIYERAATLNEFQGDYNPVRAAYYATVLDWLCATIQADSDAILAQGGQYQEPFYPFILAFNELHNLFLNFGVEVNVQENEGEELYTRTLLVYLKTASLLMYTLTRASNVPDGLLIVAMNQTIKMISHEDRNGWSL